MRYPALLLSTVLIAQCPAQDIFPTVTGETADGRSVQLPKASAGRYAVIGMAFGKAAGPMLEDWYEPAYLRLIAHHGLFATSYSSDLYFVPMFVGLNKAAYEPSMKKFRKSAEPEVVDHVVFFKGEIDDLQQSLGLKRHDIPYFFVVDGEGRIVHRTEGGFSEEKMDALEEVLMQ